MMNKKGKTHVDLYTGLGGFSLAAESAGGEFWDNVVVMASDNNKDIQGNDSTGYIVKSKGNSFANADLAKLWGAAEEARMVQKFIVNGE